MQRHRNLQIPDRLADARIGPGAIAIRCGVVGATHGKRVQFRFAVMPSRLHGDVRCGRMCNATLIRRRHDLVAHRR